MLSAPGIQQFTTTMHEELMAIILFIFQTCKPCNATCKSCIGPSNSDCLSCYPPLGYNNLLRRCMKCCIETATTVIDKTCCKCIEDGKNTSYFYNLHPQPSPLVAITQYRKNNASLRTTVQIWSFSNPYFSMKF